MTARGHHYLPEFYLRGFTRSGSSDDRLVAIDLRERRCFNTGTKNVGKKRDFNRIDIDEHPPDALEAQLGIVEGDLAPALRRLRQAKEFPEEKDFSRVMNLICLLAIRNPRTRRNIERPISDVLRRVGQLSLSTEDRWRQIERQMIEEGSEPSPVSYQDLRDFVFDETRYDLRVNREFLIALEMKVLDKILRTLFDRKWIMLVANASTGPFICSDFPAALTFSDFDAYGPFNSPGFALKETDLIVPMSKEVAFWGKFETPCNAILRADERTIAVLNSRTMAFSERQIYAPSLQFRYVNASGEIAAGRSLLPADE